MWRHNRPRSSSQMTSPPDIWMLTRPRHPVATPDRPEARADGAIEAAAFAQPSGLAADRRRAVCRGRAESNLVRRCGRSAAGEAGAHATPAGSLFEFGRRSAGHGRRRCGCSTHSAVMHVQPMVVNAIADTHNHKIKLLDPEPQRGLDACRHAPGTARTDGTGRKAQFYEPGGSSVWRATPIYRRRHEQSSIRRVDARRWRRKRRGAGCSARRAGWREVQRRSIGTVPDAPRCRAEFRQKSSTVALWHQARFTATTSTFSTCSVRRFRRGRLRGGCGPGQRLARQRLSRFAAW